MSEQKTPAVHQLAQKAALGRFCFSTANLRQLLFTVFFLLFSAAFVSSFVIDALMTYPLCEICILQRFIMFLLSITSGVGLLLAPRIPAVGLACMVVIGLLLGCGFGFSVSRMYMTHIAVVPVVSIPVSWLQS